jgi:threonylcarbamoyladenosine tRNA methylthiotransferase CDKAL1
MNREYTREEFETVCDYLIQHVPGITIATDIICGFPGETEEQFDETMSLVGKYKFRVLNISQFYSRPGTAAEKMKKCNTKDVKVRS